MSNLEKLSKDQLIKYLQSTLRERDELKNRVSELQKEINNLQKQLGEESNLYPDTPSLPVIRLGISTYSGEISPYCEKHGAMNCYDHEIYRCTACGIAVDMTKFRELVKQSSIKET